MSKAAETIMLRQQGIPYFFKNSITATLEGNRSSVQVSEVALPVCNTVNLGLLRLLHQPRPKSPPSSAEAPSSPRANACAGPCHRQNTVPSHPASCWILLGRRMGKYILIMVRCEEYERKGMVLIDAARAVVDACIRLYERFACSVRDVRMAKLVALGLGKKPWDVVLDGG
ncbi:uncharacterized protein EDB93DRAFT_1103077 [Suillus bovinus]|uniref:uncharacterized protein n=1 Tax=Suillus bovinus TaxID=48563 RepID=UPI001B870A64|nr:uncharacterized protein EDB93DRAFT_1103077 [Suillus bovinus]KAG2151642.1 hypothetical protein EDB93DRAFT_1103077 [Suillus bovinus]